MLHQHTLYFADLVDIKLCIFYMIYVSQLEEENTMKTNKPK